MRAVSKALGAILTASALAGLSAVAAVAATSADAATTASTATAATTASSPTFGYGTDSWPTTVTGNGPYKEPVIGGNYSGYIGMAGNWARVEGCKTGNFLAWNQRPTATRRTPTTPSTTSASAPASTGTWAAPGSTRTATAPPQRRPSGARAQAADALAAMKTHTITYPVVWADIELPGIEPALDNGWNSVYSSPCSERVVQTSVPANVDRADFNGFADYITAHSTYKVGVYTANSVWTSIFGTGTASRIPNTYEWTYWPETSHLSQAPERLVPARGIDVRAVVRRAVLVEQVHPDVAVVGRRRRHQRRRRLRPDRHRAAEVAPGPGSTIDRAYTTVPASSGSSLSDGLSRWIAFSRHLSANSASSAPSSRRVSTSAPRAPASTVMASSSVCRASS